MDVSPTTWQMDLDKVDAFLREECELRSGVCVNRRSGRRVRAIVPVHILGLACDIEQLTAMARRHGLWVVEDATEALGVTCAGRHVGTFGHLGVFSFNGNKIITTGGGGMIVTDDPALAARARYLTTQAKDDPIEYRHEEIGFNYRLTNVLAALGCAQLEQLDGFIRRKRDIAARYDRGLRRVPGVTPMPKVPNVESNAWLYTCLLPPGTTVDRRRAVVASLNTRMVGARPLWHTIHDLTPFRQFQAYAVEHAPDLYARAISLPSGAGLADEDVDYVIDQVCELVNGEVE
jgi:perosamine synthetase